MSVSFWVSRGKESNQEHIEMIKSHLESNNKTYLELGLKSKMSVLRDFRETDIDCLLLYDVEKYGELLQKSLIRAFNKTSVYKKIYVFIEVLDSGYDFTYSPLYNTYS